MAIDSQKLIGYAARGVPGAMIATALGVSESRISQLLQEELVVSKVEQKRAELAIKDLETVTTLETVKGNLLHRIGDLVGDTESLGEAVTSYEKLDRIQSMKEGRGSESEDGVRQITMQVPIFIQNNISVITSQKNEIIDIDNRSMATMPTLDVHRMIKEQKNAQNTTQPAKSAEPEF